MLFTCSAYQSQVLNITSRHMSVMLGILLLQFCVLHYKVMNGGYWPPRQDDAPELHRERLCDPTVAPHPAPPSF